MDPNCPLASMSGIPTMKKDSVPKIIGTEIYYISEGKIFVGLIRTFNSPELDENELIVQSGSSTTRLIRYNQIIGVNPPKQIIHTYEQSVSIYFILVNENKIIIECSSRTEENINGVYFFSSKKFDDKYWQDRSSNYSSIL